MTPCHTRKEDFWPNFATVVSRVKEVLMHKDKHVTNFNHGNHMSRKTTFTLEGEVKPFEKACYNGFRLQMFNVTMTIQNTL